MQIVSKNVPTWQPSRFKKENGTGVDRLKLKMNPSSGFFLFFAHTCKGFNSCPPRCCALLLCAYSSTQANSYTQVQKCTAGDLCSVYGVLNLWYTSLLLFSSESICTCTHTQIFWKVERYWQWKLLYSYSWNSCVLVVLIQPETAPSTCTHENVPTLHVWVLFERLKLGANQWFRLKHSI